MRRAWGFGGFTIFLDKKKKKKGGKFSNNRAGGKGVWKQVTILKRML